MAQRRVRAWEERLGAGREGPRLLLVGVDPTWRDLAERGAAQLGARLDVVPDVPAAIRWMLDPHEVYDHVLASAPLGSRDIDALAGMLDEVTLRPTPLLLLGCRSHAGACALQHLHSADVTALVEALRTPPGPETPGAPLSPGELVSALHSGGLRMRFQPVVRATDLRPIGLEALARIHLPARGILHPKDFIPATAASGRERVLTGIVAARTLIEIARLLAGTDYFVSINLPLTSVLHDSALTRGLELCAVANIPPSRVVLEVLESRTAPDLALLRRALERWRGQGFQTAIDDAGPALPHWREMLDLPFDKVKLDGTLVTSPGGMELMRSIVGEAKARGRFVIAEGVEDEACLERVRPLGVDALQGFLFARPLPAMALPEWLRQHEEARGAVLAA